MTTVAAQVRVSGVVQGVGFRYYTLKRARELGLTGWVKNDPDGAVSARVEGDRGAIEAFIGHMKTGPPSASVSDVAATWEPFTGKYPNFDLAF